MKRSTNSERPRRSTGLESRSSSMMSSTVTRPGAIARHQVAARIGGMADADVAVGVEHAAVVEDAVRQHQLLDRGGRRFERGDPERGLLPRPRVTAALFFARRAAE